MHQGGSKRLHGAPVSRKPPVRAPFQSDPVARIACDQCGEALCDWRPFVRGRGGMSRRIVTIGPSLGVSGYRRRMIKAHTTHRRQFADKDDDHGEGPDVGGLPIKKRLQLADAARRFSMIWRHGGWL